MSRSRSPKRRHQVKEYNPVEVCIETGKRCYRSRKRALTAMNHLRSEKGKWRSVSTKPSDVYECPFCSAWHLTSRPTSPEGTR